jgi:hypothetical protein
MRDVMMVIVDAKNLIFCIGVPILPRRKPTHNGLQKLVTYMGRASTCGVHWPMGAAGVGMELLLVHTSCAACMGWVVITVILPLANSSVFKFKLFCLGPDIKGLLHVIYPLLAN